MAAKFILQHRARIGKWRRGVAQTTWPEGQARERFASTVLAESFLAELLPAQYSYVGGKMLEATSTARIVMTTVASAEEGARLGRTLVEERLAACATVLPSAHSIYSWQGKIESSDETLLLLKTATDQLPTLESRLQELHSYETPEFLVIEIEAGSESYLKWLRENLGAQPGTKV